MEISQMVVAGVVTWELTSLLIISWAFCPSAHSVCLSIGPLGYLPGYPHPFIYLSILDLSLYFECFDVCCPFNYLKSLCSWLSCRFPNHSRKTNTLLCIWQEVSLAHAELMKKITFYCYSLFLISIHHMTFTVIQLFNTMNYIIIFK